MRAIAVIKELAERRAIAPIPTPQSQPRNFYNSNHAKF